MKFDSINPATGTVNETFTGHTQDQVAEILSKTQAAWQDWRKSDFDTRAKLLQKAAGVLRKKKEPFAQLMAKEMGKPLREGVSEAEKCAAGCEYYAEQGSSFLQPRMIDTDARKSYVTYKPLGLILAIMPWNFPFWQLFRFAAPALMAGNGVIIKHAPRVPACAKAIESIFRDAGFPSDLVRTILIDEQDTELLIEDRRIAGVTLTGSTRAGRAVAEIAGRNLKKCVLELGGSDPFVILDDADIAKAIEVGVTSRLINSGQSCIAAKRFIVPQHLLAPCEEAMVKLMASKKMGDPLDPDTDIGPLARKNLRDALHLQVERSVDHGAKLLLGGIVPDMDGFYYPPTVLSDVKRGMPAYDEELFGPVASIIPASDENEALAIANDSHYGLGATIFTGDTVRGEKMASDLLDAGCCFVNDFVRSDPRMPFGGIKDSGFGRELSEEGIREFVNIKTVYVA